MDDKITIHLRPDFAVYALSSLEVIREALERDLDTGDDPVVKTRVAALEVLCSEIAKALDEQTSREKIDDIIQDFIDRYA